MADFEVIKATIDAEVNTNGNREITGEVLNGVLNSMVDEVNDKKQDTLVSGENIKTINGNSLLGSGNIKISSDDSELRGDIAELEADVLQLSQDKVSKEAGKGLSTNDFTTAEKEKLAGLENYNDSELRGDISELEEEVSEVLVVINGNPQETLGWQAEGYYVIDSSVSEGAVVNINVQPNSVYRCLMVECAEGDSFLYTGRNGIVRPFAFLDSAYRLLPNYGVFGTKYTNKQITAPEDSAYVVMQTLYAEWVELGSLPLQRLGSKGIAEEAEKVKDAVFVTPSIRTAKESVQAFANLKTDAIVLNNICPIGNFLDASKWQASPNQSSNITMAIQNGVLRLTSTAQSGNATCLAKAIDTSWAVVPTSAKVFIAYKVRTNLSGRKALVMLNSALGYEELSDSRVISDKEVWEDVSFEVNCASAATFTVMQIGVRGSSNMPNDTYVEIKDFVMGVYPTDTSLTKEDYLRLISPKWIYGDSVVVNPQYIDKSTLSNDVIVSVGANGDFQSLNAAMAYLSKFYPMYKYGGIKAEIRILNGTTITDQVLVVGADYSWMTITHEGYNPDALTYDNVAESIANGTIVFGQTSGYNAVAVDASSWGSSGVTHDTRGDVCLFRAEDGGRLPKIKCVFKLTNKGEYDVAGICCNRGSSCVVTTLCGFIGFNDGVIANNESSVTIREGITMNCGRWGCHARHNGEVSARSVIATGCATDAKYSGESAALCADRIADLDGREAWVSCGNALAVRNASRMNCNGLHILGSADETAIIYATAVSVGNFISMYVDAGVKIDYSQGAMLSIGEYTFRESYVFNNVTNKGIIYQ